MSLEAIENLTVFEFERLFEAYALRRERELLDRAAFVATICNYCFSTKRSPRLRAEKLVRPTMTNLLKHGKPKRAARHPQARVILPSDPGWDDFAARFKGAI